MEKKQKSVILLGKTDFIKSTVAELIMKGLKSVTLDGRNPNLFKYSCSGIPIGTEIIHICDVEITKENINYILSAVNGGIQVNNKHESPFETHPLFIISTSTTIKKLRKLDKYLDRRFDHFEIKNTYELPF